MVVTYNWPALKIWLHFSELSHVLRAGSPRRASNTWGLLHDILSVLCPNIKSKDFGTHRALLSTNSLQGLCVRVTTWSGSVSLGPTRHAFCMSDAVMHVYNLGTQTFESVNTLCVSPSHLHSSKIHSILFNNYIFERSFIIQMWQIHYYISLTEPILWLYRMKLYQAS